MNWFRYTFGEGIISVLPALEPLGRAGVLGKQIEEGGVPMRRPVYHGHFAGRNMSEAYAHKAWKRFTDIGKDLKNLSTMNDQGALISEEDEALAAEVIVVAVPTVDKDALLNTNKDDGWEI